MSPSPRDTRIFFGWYIVAASFFILFFNGGARYAFGVMLKPTIAEFSWSRGLASAVLSCHMIVFAVGLTVTGKVYDRYGPKWVIIISTLFISAGFILTACMRSIGQFFFSYGLLAALGSAGTALPLLGTLTMKWFARWRGLAISLAMSGNAIGQFILVPVLSFLAVAYSWRIAYICIGLAMLVINVLLALLVIKGDPHHLGLKPFGANTKTTPQDIRPEATTRIDAADLNLEQALKTSSFCLFAVVMFVCGAGDFFTVTHLIAMATDQGIPALTAGNMLAWYGGMSLVGILIAAPAADRIGNKIPIIITFLMRFCLCLLLYESKTIGAFYVFALAFGFTHLITGPLTPMLIGKLYGSTHLGLLTGFINAVHFAGAAAWPLLAGILFDKTGNYQLTLILSAIAAAVAVMCSIFIVEKRHCPAIRKGLKIQGSADAVSQ